MADYGGRVGEDFAAGGMVLMVVTVDEILDRLVETLFDLRLQPFGGASIDRIGDHYALVGDVENREVKIVLEPVDIAGDLGNRPFRRLLRRDGPRRNDQ